MDKADIFRIIVILINVLLILASLALIAFGFILRFAHEVLRKELKSVLNKLEDSVKDLGYDAEFNTDKFELGSMVSNIATAMIVVGIVLLALCFLACCGSCYNITTIMLVYAIILIVIALVQVVMVVLVFGFPDTLKDRIKPRMKSSLDEYQGINGTTVVSLGWNWAMQQYDCCGVTDYTDFTDLPTWWARDTYLTPVACCKDLPSTDATRLECAGHKTTGSFQTIDTIAAKSNYNKGCLDAVWDVVVKENTKYFLTVVIFCLAVQVVLIIFAILVYKDRGITGGLI